MKKCLNCNKTYDDSKMFCPNCGAKLVSDQPPAPAPAAGGSSASFMDQWGGLLLCVLGLIVEWEISVLAGAVITAMGFVAALNSSNSINKIVSFLVSAIAAVLLFLIWLL